MATANIAKFSVRVDAQLKSEAEMCLEDMGMTMSTAINVYLHSDCTASWNSLHDFIHANF